MKLPILACVLLIASNVILSSGLQRQSREIIFRNSKLKLQNDNNVQLNVTGDQVNFIVLGDWGGIPVFPYRTLVEQRISSYMGKIAQQYNTQFQIGLGDNFYFQGIKNEYDKRFQDTFEDVFKSEYLQTPWFHVLGNHDHYTNASGQIAYSKHSKRWIMPDYNYTVNVNINNGQKSLIGLLNIDTVILCGQTGDDYGDKASYVPRYASHDDKLRSIMYFQAIEDELRKMSEAKIPYIIVSGHFPVWSVSEHGPTQCLVDRLRPLLHKYNVSIYFAGHEHDMQHLQDSYLDVQVDYIISGAANTPLKSSTHMNNVPVGSLKFYWSEDVQLNGAICLVEANLKNMTITYLETSGKTLYRLTILNKFHSN